MAFEPNVHQDLVIDGSLFYVAEHPEAPGMPYGQEGKQAIVYQLVSGEDRRALKIFKPMYRLPEMVSLAQRMAPFAELPGLEVCQRTVLTPQRHGALLHQERELIYAVLMPWIEGPTWMEVVVQGWPLPPNAALALARALAEVLAAMEQHSLAHCDLSGPNVLLPALLPMSNSKKKRRAGEGPVALVDVEQMFGPGIDRPIALPAGSLGYAHRDAPKGLWSADADRFAGAILLAEMLGWCDERIRTSAWGESYFHPDKMQQEDDRFRLMLDVLRERWGEPVARLLDRCWNSETLIDCPTFGEWQIALPDLDIESALQPANLILEPRPEEVLPPAFPGPGSYSPAIDGLSAWLEQARQQAATGDLTNAMNTCQYVVQQAPATSNLAQEANQLLNELYQRCQQMQISAEQRLVQAQAEEQAGRWSAAQALYEQLLSESELTSAQRAAAQTGSENCYTELHLADLFDSATQAIAAGNWAAAYELLSGLVQQRPEYTRNGQRAAKLLATVRSRVNSRWTGVPIWRRWPVLAVMGIVLIGCSAGTIAARLAGIWPPQPVVTPPALTSTVDTPIVSQPGESTTPRIPATPTHLPGAVQSPTPITPSPTPTITDTPRPTNTQLPPPTQTSPKPSNPSPIPSREVVTQPAIILPKPGSLIPGTQVTVQWTGSLSSGQRYVVHLRHSASHQEVPSPGLTGTTWTSPVLPLALFGEWHVWVEVVRGNTSLTKSSSILFYLDTVPSHHLAASFWLPTRNQDQIRRPPPEFVAQAPLLGGR